MRLPASKIAAPGGTVFTVTTTGVLELPDDDATAAASDGAGTLEGPLVGTLDAGAATGGGASSVSIGFGAGGAVTFAGNASCAARAGSRFTPNRCQATLAATTTAAMITATTPFELRRRNCGGSEALTSFGRNVSLS